MSRIKDLRMQLSEDDIKNLLAKYGVYTQAETDKALIFPTACHNLEGGSHKLYYYKEDKIFKCYTGCNEMFDIFSLLQKMKKLRGQDINLKDAINLSGVEDNNEVPAEILSDLEYLRKLKNSSSTLRPETEVRILDSAIMDRYTFNLTGIDPWIKEGISVDALKKFNIKYDSTINAIIIPNLDHNGNLIGVRGRFYGENAPAKYMPVKVGNEFLSHPTGKFLYGYYENKQTIREKGIVVIFEGEKSVLKMETYYPGNNIGLATAGKKITLDQLNSLLKLNVHEVVLAYDKDYRTPEERKAKLEEYEKITQLIKPYFRVSIIMDYGNDLWYKDSPIDKGKATFDDLMKNRIKR